MNDFEKAHESWLAEREHLLAEVETLRGDLEMADEAIRKTDPNFTALQAEVERLRRERDNAGGEEWSDYEETRAEVERLREIMATTESTAVAEVKRLRQLNADFQAAWTRARQDMKTEIERLRAALEAMRDASPQSYDWYQNKARAALAKEET